MSNLNLNKTKQNKTKTKSFSFSIDKYRKIKNEWMRKNSLKKTNFSQILKETEFKIRIESE